jgi:CBS domain-containing protein
MGRDVHTVREDTPLTQVARRFARDDAEVAIVVRDRRAVGALRPQDVLAWMSSSRRGPARRRA